MVVNDCVAGTPTASGGREDGCTMTNDSSPTPPPGGPILTAEDGFLTKRELSLRLKKTPRCIETWMKRRYLPYIKIGHSVFPLARCDRRFAPLRGSLRILKFRERAGGKLPLSQRSQGRVSLLSSRPRKPCC